MASIIQKALENAKQSAVKIETISTPKEKPNKGKKSVPVPYNVVWKPSLYLDDKQLANIGQYKAGDKVVLVIECNVRSVNTSDRIIDGKSEKRHDAEIEIESFADITPPSNGGK